MLVGLTAVLPCWHAGTLVWLVWCSRRAGAHSWSMRSAYAARRTPTQKRRALVWSTVLSLSAALSGCQASATHFRSSDVRSTGPADRATSVKRSGIIHLRSTRCSSAGSNIRAAICVASSVNVCASLRSLSKA